MDLSGKVVLVTGAARRVGRAIATTFAARGADIALHRKQTLAPPPTISAKPPTSGSSCVRLTYPTPLPSKQ
jgi:NAD(P)-dependent dehydrogenase (short-subunit alcohol dehydrogenase family)